MKRLLLFIIIAAAAATSFSLAAAGSQSVSKPDFAFPQQVSKNAEKSLNTAIKAADDQAILRSLMDLTLAQGMIDNDNLPAVYHRINDLCPKMTSASARSLTRLLQASILSDIYSNNRSKYDERHLPLTPLPADWTEWSGDQFRAEIMRLIDEALADTAALQSTPLSAYGSILTFNHQTEIYFPTLYDFAVTHAIYLLDTNFEIPNSLSLTLVDDLADFPRQSLKAINSPVASKILNLYSDLLRFNQDKYAPRINTMLDALDFITSNLYDPHSDEADAKETEFLTNQYNKYFPLTEYSGDILQLTSLSNYSDTKDYYTVLTNFITRYPGFWRNDCFNSCLFSLKQPAISFSVPNYISPGKEFTAVIRNANSREYYFNIYRLDPSRDILLSQTPIFNKKITTSKEAPFSSSDSLNVTLSDFGRYLAVVSTDNAAPTGKNIIRNGTVITCTSIALGSVSGSDIFVYSLNPETGAPVGNVELYTKIRDTETTIGHTDKTGMVEIAKDKKPANGFTVYPRLNNDLNGISAYISNNVAGDKNITRISNISLCDLPIYHPGDSINWETIIYSSDASARRPQAGYEVRAILNNANWLPIDTLVVTTDEFGRACSSFLLPEGELTGSYAIEFQSVKKSADNVSDYLSPLGFLVSDYKLPTFKVEMLNNVMNTPANGDVTVRGRVVTLSGVGLANTQVQLSLSATDRFRFGYSYGGQSFYADSVTTAADGSFSFVIPDSVLSYSPFPKGRFNATVSATSLSGESQQATTSFSRGASYSIIANLYDTDFDNDDIESSKPTRVYLKVLDADGKAVDQQVKLTVTPANKKEINKGFTSIISPSTKELDLRSLNPGDYYFTFTIADPQLKEVSDSVETTYTIFRLNDSRSPYGYAVWGAKSNRNSRLAPGEKARIVYAVPADDTHLLYVLTSADSIIETKWLKCKQGVHEMEVAIPKGKTSANVSLIGCRDFDSATFSEKISYTEDSLKIECESFRDKLIPGAEETWSFRIRSTSGSAQRSALALGMYNAALEQFNSSNWNLKFNNIFSGSINPYLYIRKTSHLCSADLKSPKNPYDCISLTEPGFQTYGYPLVSWYRTSRIMYKTMATANAGGIKSEEALSFDSAPPMRVMHSSAVTVDALRGQVPGLEVAESAIEDRCVVSADEDSGLALDEVVTVSSPQNPAQPEFEYRDGETVLAFFRPSLTTDADGSLTFSFTVPNANTTWRLNAMAYTENLLSAALNRTFVANKPVMVTPNLPRFLRSGDSATISSLVVNNSDEEQTIVTTTEIFDPLSGNILSSSTSTDRIAPGQNTTVNTTLNAPFDATAIGVRVKSATPTFADGEQSLLPILPSSEPVIETTPFYIAPDSTSFSLSLPKIGSDARVTLEYCDNPAWYVVTALPGLRQQKISTPSDAAATIFSAAVAEGILRSNPAIADALRQWTASDRSDSTLTSMLSRNADLKTLLLQATPWMVDAMTDTQRMQRLALLFDSKEIAQAYNSSIDLLRRLQRNSGGWAWIASSDEPSQWATSEALTTLGRLNRLGYLPADKSLASMISQALAWHQSQIEKDFSKYPKASYYSFLRLRDLWPDHKPSLTGKTIINREVQKLVSGWKKQTIDQKAQSALLLAHNGYRSLASTLLKSIGEFAKSTPSKGMWWPSVGMDGSMEQLQVSADVLTALHELSPASPDIDPIRQWLILQKEARNWGSSVTTSEVICAILSSSKSWIQPAAPATISVGSHQVPASYSDATLGYLRTDISALSPSLAELSIVKSGSTPSWGAVYSQSRMTMTDIAPASCEAVSIEKRLYRLQGSEWLQADTLRVGDRVKVQLLIHADRAMQYVAITDSRAACLEPVEQLPTPIFSQGLCFYRENLDASTRLFISNLPRGTYMLEYELWVNNAGTFSSGIATLQSQYAPQLSAHSAGSLLPVAP